MLEDRWGDSNLKSARLGGTVGALRSSRRLFRKSTRMTKTTTNPCVEKTKAVVISTVRRWLQPNEVSERMGIPIHRAILRFHKHPELEVKFQDKCSEQFLPQVRKIGLALDVYMLGYFIFTIAGAATSLFSTEAGYVEVGKVDWVSYGVRGGSVVASMLMLLPLYIGVAARWKDPITHAALWKHLAVTVIVFLVGGIIFSNAYKWGPKKPMYATNIESMCTAYESPYAAVACDTYELPNPTSDKNEWLDGDGACRLHNASGVTTCRPTPTTVKTMWSYLTATYVNTLSSLPLHFMRTSTFSPCNSLPLTSSWVHHVATGLPLVSHWSVCHWPP